LAVHHPNTLYNIITYSPTFFFFFFNDTATTEIYTLSLHDALPICESRRRHDRAAAAFQDLVGLLVIVYSHRSGFGSPRDPEKPPDRKSTRLNSSHLVISYAVFCLKKKKKK